MTTAREQWLQVLLTDVEAFNQWRRDNPKEPIDLEARDLSGASLAHASLGDANLRRANLRDANLTRANLAGANLQEADLRQADLTDATLHRVDLTGADMRGAKVGGLVGEGRICLHPTCFQNVLYDREQLEGVLDVLNRNAGWHIRYELVPKGTDVGRPD